MASSEEANLQGFGSSLLGASNASAPTLAMQAKAGYEIVFDREGNAWTFGPTLAEARILRYPRAGFDAAGAVAPDRELWVTQIDCIGTRAMAFGPNGSLWVAACGALQRLDADTLATPSATVDADATLSGLDDIQDLAFDGAGNLWVADAGYVKRYDAARLTGSTATAADAVLTVRNAENTGDLTASYLAFDGDGDLWIVDFGGNRLAEVKASALTSVGSANAVPAVTIALDVQALLARPAFDDAGGLWVSYRRGQVARIAPSALSVSTDAGAPTTPDVVLSSPTIGYAANVAFFPAAAGLPLYHAHD
ncbi:MAG: hypothetical protein QM756_45570 [Polyangiaceae bacterium]